MFVQIHRVARRVSLEFSLRRWGLKFLARFVLIISSFITIVVSIKYSMTKEYSNVTRFVAIPFISLFIQTVLVCLLFKFKGSLAYPEQVREIALCEFDSRILVVENMI